MIVITYLYVFISQDEEWQVFCGRPRHFELLRPSALLPAWQSVRRYYSGFEV